MIKLNKKGFTLVELLAVIVILALLMVVATRTIGTSLTDSKKKAMSTEASKIVSKTYEDLETANLMVEEPKYTYENVNTTGAKDGDYTIIIGITNTSNTYKMNNVCVSDGKKYSLGTISGSTITFDKNAEYQDGCCELSGGQAQGGAKCSD